MNNVRQVSAFAVICIFVTFFLFAGIRHQVGSDFNEYHRKQPDLGQYSPPRSLSLEEFPIGDDQKRTIIVGDIHGMDRSLHALLVKLSYDPKFDTLIHAGDFQAKGSHQGSMGVLSFMTAYNITGVRGNHDQKVIEWRAWMDWVRTFPDGRDFLDGLGDTADTSQWSKQDRKEDQWWDRIPDGWDVYDDHYRLARALSKEHYNYLLSLPVVLHAPHAHAFVVHGGLLSSDPRYDPASSMQPLANAPVLSIPNDENGRDREASLRLYQEQALLEDVPQNIDPWTVMNIRGVLENNTVTRGKKGTPWSELWNADMSRCNGFQLPSAKRQKDNSPLSCMPVTVVYGHAASRGLDIKRWSKGLDTGCVYGKRLTALVLGSNATDSRILYSDPDDQEVAFGESGSGMIVSVKCDLRRK